MFFKPRSNHRPASGKVFRRLLPVFILLLPGIGIAIPLLLPRMVESQVNRLLDSLTQNGKVTVEIKRLTLTGADLALAARPDDPERPASHIENLSLRYSPLRLIFGRHIDHAAIRGVRLPVSVGADGVSLPLLEMFSRKTAPTATTAPAPFRPEQLPVGIGSLELDGFLEIHVRESAGMPEDTIQLPFHADFAAAAPRRKEINYQLQAVGANNRLSCQGRFSGADSRLAGQLELALDSRYLPYALRARLPEHARGAVRLQTDFDADLAQNTLNNLRGDAQMSLRLPLADDVLLSGNPRLHWQLTQGRVEADLSDLALQTNAATLKLAGASGNFDLAAAAGSGALRLQTGHTEARLTFNIRKTPENTWHLALQTVPDAAVPAVPEGKLQISRDRAGRFQLQGDFGTFTLRRPEGTLELGALEISGSGDMRKFQAEARLRDLVFTSPALRLDLPRTKAAIQYQPGNLTGGLQTEHGKVLLPSAAVAAEEVALDVPVAFPAPRPVRGLVKIGRILLQKHDVGHLAAETAFRDGTMELVGSGELLSLRTDFNAAAGLDDRGFALESRLAVPEQTLNAPPVLTALLARKVGDLQFSGKVALEADYAVHAGRSRGRADFQLREGRLSSQEKDMDITGLAMKFALPYLPELRSDSGQTVGCEAIRYGKIQTGAAHLQLRMDAPASWCLERMLLNWCGGKIRSEYLHFNPNSPQIAFTVHCDRLDLVSFLVQMGAGEGRSNGGGKISGTLPAVYRRGGAVTVRDGFLYSAPGEEGHIALEFSEAVKESQPASPVFDMTREALKDFHYSWAKIHMATEEKLLKMTMRLNGKPGKPLYYTYQAGEIVKTAVPHIFQGIMLDVNLALPLTDVFDLLKQF